MMSHPAAVTMTEDEQEAELGTYELRVQGHLGPLLLSALPHAASVRVPSHTMLIADGRDDQDLVEIVRLILATDLQVESIRETTHDEAVHRVGDA
jgi:hypothetical protein